MATKPPTAEEYRRMVAGESRTLSSASGKKKKEDRPGLLGQIGKGIGSLASSIVRPAAIPFAGLSEDLSHIGKYGIVRKKNEPAMESNAFSRWAFKNTEPNDPKRAGALAGSAAGLALTAGTLGTGSAAIQSGKLGVKETAKSLARQALKPKNVLLDVGLGGAGAGFDASARGEDLMGSLKAGAIGGALGAVAPVALGVGGKLATTAVKKSFTGTNKLLAGAADVVGARADRLQKAFDENLDATMGDYKKVLRAQQYAGVADRVKNVPNMFVTGLIKPYAQLSELGTKIKDLTGKAVDMAGFAQRVPSAARGVASNYEKRVSDVLSAAKDELGEGGKLKALRVFQRFADLKNLQDRAKMGQKVAGGRSLEQLQAEMDVLKSRLSPRELGVVSRLQTETQEILTDILNQTLNAGRISVAEFARFRATHPNYMPNVVMDFLENPSEFFAKQGLSTTAEKLAEGSERELQDSFVSLVNYIRTSVLKNEQNKAARAIFDEVEATGQAQALGIKRLASIDDVPKEVDLRKNDLDVFKFWRDGEQVAYTVPRDLGYALKNLDPNDLSLLGKLTSSTLGKIALVAPADFVRATATNYNPLFTFIRNPIRDVFEASIKSSVGLRDFAWVAMHKLADTVAPGTGMAQRYQAAMKQAAEAGGILGTGYYGRNVSAKSIIQKALDGDGMFTHTIKHPLQTYQDLGGAIEDNVRLSVFIASMRETGGDVAQAAKLARQTTADFSEAGNWARELNKIIPYLNARIRGVDSLFQAVDRDPIGVARKSMYYAAYPAIVLHNMNSQYESYQNIPDWEKKSYWIIMTGEVPGKTKAGDEVMIPLYIKVPKGETQQIVGAMVDRMLDTSDVKESNFEFLQELAGSLSPVTLGQGIVPAIAPTGLKMPFELAANMDFFTGKPIERDYIPTPDGKTKPRKELKRKRRVDYDTTETAKALAELFPLLSPAKIDHLINRGSLGYVLQGIDLAVEGREEQYVEPDEKNPLFEASLIPGVGSFIGTSSYGGELTKQEQELLEQQEIHEQMFRNTLERKDAPIGTAPGGAPTAAEYKRMLESLK